MPNETVSATNASGTGKALYLIRGYHQFHIKLRWEQIIIFVLFSAIVTSVLTTSSTQIPSLTVQSTSALSTHLQPVINNLIWPINDSYILL